MTTDVVLNVAALTDVGLRREINEDAVLAQSPVFLVADGMGGHDAGDKASAAVVEAFAPLAGNPVSMEEIGAALARANERVSAISAQHARGAGSTVAAVALVEHESAPHWLVFNVGDSRVYRHRGSSLEQLTVDHSLGQELVDAGELRPENLADFFIDELLAEAPVEGYAIRSWMGPVPDEIVAAWAALDAVLDTEAPIGELDIEAASADVADYRADEQMQALQGRTSFGTVALTSDGRVAAYTQLVVSGDDGNAYQWGTLVRREDRGHRLGLRVKLENLRMLQRHSPETPRIYTYNAASNAHMLAVNTRLGFRPTGRLGELQKKVDRPRAPWPDARA